MRPLPPSECAINGHAWPPCDTCHGRGQVLDSDTRQPCPDCATLPEVVCGRCGCRRLMTSDGSYRYEYQERPPRRECPGSGTMPGPFDQRGKCPRCTFTYAAIGSNFMITPSHWIEERNSSGY
jgi:hypothetical protein